MRILHIIHELYDILNELKKPLDKISQVKICNNNNIILFKIQQLKKVKKKAIYRIETIRIVQEIANLEFCLNAIVQDIIIKKLIRINKSGLSFTDYLCVYGVLYSADYNFDKQHQNMRIFYIREIYYPCFNNIFYNLLYFTKNRYKSPILVFFCIFAFDYISYVPILWYARILSSIRNNQPN